MRSISQNGLNTLATSRGTEPVSIVDIQWNIDGSEISYADKDIVSVPGMFVPGKILSIDNFDDVLDITNSGTSQSFNITLDDTDGSIKAIMDSTDIHKRNVSLYQWFDGLAYSDRFLVFSGKINTPIEWSEKDRTVTFSVVSTLEDLEVGFSPEEGQFSFIADELIGVGWPMDFGYPVNAPTVKLNKTAQGLLGQAISMQAITNHAMGAGLGAILNFLNQLWYGYTIEAGFLLISGQLDAADQAQQLADQANQEYIQYQSQYQLPFENVVNGQIAGFTGQFRVVGGYNFPQGKEITININGAHFTGVMNYETFTVNTWVPVHESMPTTFPYALGWSVSYAGGNAGFFVPTGQIGGGQSDPFFAQAGGQVTMFSNEPISYIVSIVPGAVVNVTSKATLHGGYQTHLFDVPSSLYSVTTETFGSISAVVLTVFNALSKPMALQVLSARTPLSAVTLLPGQIGYRFGAYRSYQVNTGMSDNLYVTFQSAVGPNVADILEYLILTYTSYTYDVASFTAAATFLANYPANFSMSDRKPVMQVLQEIAFQARCGLYLKNGVFFLNYLPATPTSVATITESDILADPGMKVTYLPRTEDVWTKMKGSWKAQGAQERNNVVILRYNVKKYGINEQDIDYYIYNMADLVIKSMTFWMIRKGNTWKVAEFSTPLSKLNLETFDGVTLNFQKPYVANAPVLGLVQQANYNSATNAIDFQVWTPIRAGEMTPYDFAFPQGISTVSFFPTIIEEDDGFAGSVGVQRNALGGNVGQQNLGGIGSNGFSYLNDPYRIQYFGRRYADVGDRKPSDQGDVNPGIPIIVPSGPVTGGDEPPPNVPINPGPISQEPQPFKLDIRTTIVADSQNNTNCTLDQFFQSITSGRLIMRDDIQVSDGDNLAIFDLKYDSVGGKWGVGTAFLQGTG